MPDGLAAVHLDVYDTAEGWWSPDHGVVTVPAGWELLPAGDPTLTRAGAAAAVDEFLRQHRQ